MLRPDRLATLAFFNPMRRLTGSGSSTIPILMYHSISPVPETGRYAYFRTCTHPRRFVEHMELLSQCGYQAVTVSEAARRLAAETACGKIAAITFDDGYVDFLTEAFPSLARFGFTATVYLATTYIGDSARTFKGFPCLTWTDVRQLRRAGVEFGSHTATHPQLAGLNTDAVREELWNSKEEIENRLGEHVESFAYPYAFPETDAPFRRMLRQTLAGCGYRNGVTTIIGTACPSSDPFFLERLPVNSADDNALLAAKLNGGYDWLHSVQSAAKFSKRLFGRGVAEP